MNKAELVAAVAEKSPVSRKEVEAVLDHAIAIIEETLINGEAVKISGLGNLTVKERAERVGTNPSSQEKITIPATKTVTFKPSKALKEKLK